jgi:fructose-1,6-bisphosphatase/inositol monophosphatase family enzyme
VNDDTLLEALHEASLAIGDALDGIDDWGLAGTRPGQHLSDLAADAAALAVLERAGVGVLSEESGAHRPDRDLVVVVDPLDGSTNAAHGIPWYAASLCAVDRDGPRAAVVVNLASGDRFEAIRGAGARRNGSTIRPSACNGLGEALIGLAGHAPTHAGWDQYRTLGAAALDLCAVAGGVLDGYLDCGSDAHAPWDYLGGLLVCREAGAPVVDADDRDLVVVDFAARRTPVAAATPALLAELLDARRGWSSRESTIAPMT